MDYLKELNDHFGSENVRSISHRGVEFSEFIVYLSGIGAFAGLWKLYLHLYERKHNINVKIKYQSGEQQIEAEMKQITEADFEEIKKKYPPNSDNKVNIILSE